MESPQDREIFRDVKTAKRMMQALLDVSPRAILLLDRRGTVLVANGTVSKSLGVPMERLIGSSLYDHLPYDVARYRRLHYDRVFETGKPVQFTDERAGRTFETLASPVLGSEGEVEYVAVYAQDVTEQRRLERALRESEKRYRELFDEAPVGYHEIDGEGRIIDVNKRELEMLGYEREEMVGRYIWEFVQEDMRGHFMEFIEGRIGPEATFERTYKKKDGGLLPVMVHTRVLMDEEGRIRGSRSAIMDITELKRLEEEKASLENQLMQAQKMEAIGRLAGGIAHDFNNILTVIKGTCELSLLDMKREDPLYSRIKEIEQAADRAKELIKKLLAFSRRQIIQMRVLDLNEIIRGMEGMLKRIIGEDIELVTFLSPRLGLIKGDPTQIEQAIINIVVNARDAMPEGGTLTIETKNVELDGAYVKNHLGAKVGSYVMLAISDTGIGMTKEIQERIFEPFFTTKEVGRGTGLGLSTVYGIVKQMGGNIYVYSEPKKGTTIKIYLPRTDGELEKGQEEEAIEVKEGGETILLVEDEEAVRGLAKEMLMRQGYKVIEASNPKEALELAENHKEPIHLVLTDVVMPGITGVKLFEHIKRLHPEAKVLYTSGYTENVITQHGVLKEGIDFIQKPFTFEGLVRTVREVIDRNG
jgi:PAS domain S-box-containing protein